MKKEERGREGHMHSCQPSRDALDSPGIGPILRVCPGIQGLPYFVQGFHAS